MATTITHKITPRFKWFLQCEVCPLAGAITKKFTIKDGVQNILERKLLRPKKPQYTQISLSLNKDYSPKEYTKDRNTNASSFARIRWWLVSIYFSLTTVTRLLFLSFLPLTVAKKIENITL
jgi:hypothetical protein